MENSSEEKNQENVIQNCISILMICMLCSSLRLGFFKNKFSRILSDEQIKPSTSQVKSNLLHSMKGVHRQVEIRQRGLSIVNVFLNSRDYRKANKMMLEGSTEG